ncbi:MAG: SDR family NAD(P)-dependent oxidoreductase, partial [Methyloligellaceae bacterium]
MTHPALSPGRAAVVTGAASGIGLAACKRFASLGMKVCMADLATDDLEPAYRQVVGLAPGGEDDVLCIPTDVGKPDDLAALKKAVDEVFGAVGLLMNNAVTRVGGGVWGDMDEWRQAMEVNFWGVVSGVRAFVPAMMEQGTPCLVVNTGSKQGITNPPGKLVY